MSDARSSPRLVLGLNTCYAVKRWPNPEDWARVAADLGVAEVQMSLDLLPVGFDRAIAHRYAQRARRAVEAHDLRLHSLFTGLAAYSSTLMLADDLSDRQTAEAWYADIIAISAAAGATGCGGHVGALSVAAASNPARARELRAWELDAMLRLADVAAREGLDHLEFENLAVAREYGHSIEEAHEIEESLKDSVVPWRLCLDLGHPPSLPAGTRSASPARWLVETWRNTPVVQLQQSPVGSDHHAPFTAAANATGAVDRDEVIALLREWEVPEVLLFFEIIHAHETPDTTVLDELRESVEFWRAGISAAELALQA